MGMDLEQILYKSLMYDRKSSGPRIEPWGNTTRDNFRARCNTIIRNKLFSTPLSNLQTNLGHYPWNHNDKVYQEVCHG